MLIEAPSSGKRGLEIYASGKRISQSLIDRGREDSPVAAVVPSSASAAALAATEALIVGGKILEGKTDQLADLVPDIFYIVTVQYRSRDEALQQFEMAGASR